MRYSVLGVLAATALGAAISTADVRPALADSAQAERLARQIETGKLVTDYARDRSYRGPRYPSSSRYYGRPYASRYYRRDRGGSAAGPDRRSRRGRHYRG